PYGADVLRLWVSSVDYSGDMRLGMRNVKQMSDVYRKIRNTARFLLGNLHDFDPEKDAVPDADLPELDQYMLHRMTEVFAEVKAAFESYQFFQFFQTVQNFCVVDLSNFYLDIAKDRLYISAADSVRRRSCQTVLTVAIESLAKAIAPVLSHMAEDIWQSLPYAAPAESVFESGWVKLEDTWQRPELTNKWNKLRRLRDEANTVLEQARADKAIGSSLEAKLKLFVSDADLHTTLTAMNPAESMSDDSDQVDELRYLFLVSQVEIVDSLAALAGAKYQKEVEGTTIVVVDADGQKCDRCWNYSTHVGESADDPTICDRCVAALQGSF
ncbi:MAG: class I tRNA ligase family protein, partial [Phormidesmis sp.]